METAVLTALASLETHKNAVLATSVAAEFARDPDRFERFHVMLDDLLFDFSKQRVEALTIGLLVAVAQAAQVEAKREAMFRGEIVNPTERRAALHTALRDLSAEQYEVVESAGWDQLQVELGRLEQRRMALERIASR